MQISLRSQMIAGTTAFVGATAIAMTPVAPAISIPSISSAKSAVALAAFANPISALLASAGQGASYVLNGSYELGVGSGFANFPFSGISDLVNTAYLTDSSLGGYTNVGLLPQTVSDGLPIINQLALNALDYIWNTVEAVGVAGGAVADIIWTVPATTLAVIQDLLAFDIEGAITEITNAINGVIADVSTAGNALLGAGIYVASGVITRATAVFGVLAEELPVVIGATIGQITTLLGAVVETGSAILSSFSTLDPETIWNTAVAGLLSPAGIPGVVNNLTLGAGIQTGPITTPDTVAANFVPSPRTVVQAGVKAIAGALDTPVAPLAASVSAASVRADAAPAAAVAVEAAPAAEATAGDSSAAAEDATTAAPAASAAADDSTSSDAPKASKAGASRAGR